MDPSHRPLWCLNPECGQRNSLPPKFFKDYYEKPYLFACAKCGTRFGDVPAPEPNLIWVFNLEGEFLGEFPKSFAPELYHSQLQLVEVS